MPLFPDPKAAGSRCTLGPPSPAWAGLVLAASALPPAGRPRRIPCLRCPDPAPPEQRAALSITGSRGLRAPILLHCPSDPLPQQHQSPGLSKVTHCSSGQGWGQQCHSIFTALICTPSHLCLSLWSPGLKQADALGPPQEECGVTGLLRA